MTSVSPRIGIAVLFLGLITGLGTASDAMAAGESLGALHGASSAAGGVPAVSAPVPVSGGSVAAPVSPAGQSARAPSSASVSQPPAPVINMPAVGSSAANGQAAASNVAARSVSSSNSVSPQNIAPASFGGAASVVAPRFVRSAADAQRSTISVGDPGAAGPVVHSLPRNESRAVVPVRSAMSSAASAVGVSVPQRTQSVGAVRQQGASNSPVVLGPSAPPSIQLSAAPLPALPSPNVSGVGAELDLARRAAAPMEPMIAPTAPVGAEAQSASGLVQPALDAAQPASGVAEPVPAAAEPVLREIEPAAVTVQRSLAATEPLIQSVEPAAVAHPILDADAAIAVTDRSATPPGSLDLNLTAGESSVELTSVAMTSDASMTSEAPRAAQPTALSRSYASRIVRQESLLPAALALVQHMPGNGLRRSAVVDGTSSGPLSGSIPLPFAASSFVGQSTDSSALWLAPLAALALVALRFFSEQRPLRIPSGIHLAIMPSPG